MAKLQSSRLRSSNEACLETSSMIDRSAALIAGAGTLVEVQREQSARSQCMIERTRGMIAALDINVLVAAHLLAKAASERSTADFLIDSIDVART